jgi:hypothetical protein
MTDAMPDVFISERECVTDPIWTQGFGLRDRLYTVEWMCATITKYGAQDETTAFLAVELFDQYLCRYRIERYTLQRLAIACINLAWNLAADNDAVAHPSLSAWCRITQGRHKPAELCREEMRVASGLGFRLFYPTAVDFLRPLSTQNNDSMDVVVTAYRVLELSLLSPDGPHYSPSQRAMGALRIARALSSGVGTADELLARCSHGDCCRWLVGLVISTRSPRWLEMVYDTGLLAAPVGPSKPSALCKQCTGVEN